MKNKKATKTTSPAAESANQAEQIQRRQEKSYKLYEEKREQEQRRFKRKVTSAAKKLAPKIYKKYRKEIKEATGYGVRSCRVDFESENVEYYGEDKRSEEQKFSDAVEREARAIARKQLQEDGYSLEAGGGLADTEWGSGSDALAVAGRQTSYLDIEW